MGMIVAWAILVIPSVVVAPDRQSGLVPFAQILVAGAVLGAGRQGFDMLGLRVLFASMALPIGWLLGYTVEGHLSACGSGQNCIQGVAQGGFFIAVLAAVVLVIVATPTTLVWNRSLATLRPELPWRRIAPKRWWHWVLLVVGVLAGLLALQVLLGIPSPS